MDPESTNHAFPICCVPICCVEIDGAQYVLENGAATLARYIGDADTFNVPQTVMISGTNRHVTTIGVFAFSRCNLKNVTISDYVKSIDEYAFLACEELASVTFATDSLLESIGYMAFRSCTIVTSITIPAGVTTIGASAFSGWNNIQTIRIQTHTDAPAGWDSSWNVACLAQIVWGVA